MLVIGESRWKAYGCSMHDSSNFSIGLKKKQRKEERQRGRQVKHHYSSPSKKWSNSPLGSCNSSQCHLYYYWPPLRKCFIPHKLLKGRGISQFFVTLSMLAWDQHRAGSTSIGRKWVHTGWEMCCTHLWGWQIPSQGLELQHQFWWHSWQVCLLTTQAVPSRKSLRAGARPF